MATGIEIPEQVVTEFGSGKRPAVHVTINGDTHRSIVGSMGGRFLLPLSAEHRAAAGVAVGDQVIVGLTFHTERRTVHAPERSWRGPRCRAGGMRSVRRGVLWRSAPACPVGDRSEDARDAPATGRQGSRIPSGRLPDDSRPVPNVGRSRWPGRRRSLGTPCLHLLINPAISEKHQCTYRTYDPCKAVSRTRHDTQTRGYWRDRPPLQPGIGPS